MSAGPDRCTHVRSGGIGLAPRQSLTDAYSEVAVESGHTLTLAVDDAKPSVINGDRDLLTQLFANLIENAIRHSTGASTIVLSASGDGERMAVKVRDQGPGIPVEEREKVFRRLYRLERSRTTSGREGARV